jgi:phosphopentomutase
MDLGKAVLVVMDSVGVGALPDADRFGDAGSNTFVHIYQALGGLKTPHLINLGIGNIEGIGLPEKAAKPSGCFGKAAELFSGKDTTGGHWEMAGLVGEKPFPTYPNGFPKDIIDRIEKECSVKTIGNKAASGTEIIKELGSEHVKTGALIVYTSADSVLQIAAHEDVVPLEKLYAICKQVRKIMRGDNTVGRIIARPFTGPEGAFVRTVNRKDFSITPPDCTILDAIKDAGLETAAVGKIEDIFNFRGITKSEHAHGNTECIDVTLKFMKESFSGLIFSNLVDFDMLYGHRNDVQGYGKALEYLDTRIPEMIQSLGEEDILIFTADHGCDPTTKSTDHSREYIPILVYGSKVKNGVDLGIRTTFADIGATIIEYFGLPPWKNGKSFWNDIRRGDQ